jgi:hypothetical protein
MAALLKKKWPQSATLAGEKATAWYKAENNKAYNLIYLQHPDQLVGLFQTKLHFSHRARFDLIYWGLHYLKKWATAYPDSIACINFPGVGLGGLYPDEVALLLRVLPKNVEVWSRGEKSVESVILGE